MFPGLEEVVKQLIQNKIAFNIDGGFELIENEIIVAEAAIKINGKNIVIDDFDEETANIFKERGYQVFNSNTFNISTIK